MIIAGKTILNAYGLEVAIATLIKNATDNGATWTDALTALKKVRLDVAKLADLSKSDAA